MHSESNRFGNHTSMQCDAHLRINVCGCAVKTHTFLCSEAVLGLSGVVFMLPGVAATGEDEFFSIISEGIFSWNILRDLYRNPPV